MRSLIMIILLVAMSAPVTADGGGVIAFDEPVVADLVADETDSWIFQGTAGWRVTLAVESQGGTLDPMLELEGPDGTLLASDENSGPNGAAALYAVELPDDGLYVVQVRAEDGGGDYQLTLTEHTLACDEVVGTVASYEWYSSSAGGELLGYKVYFPPCYVESGVRVPYVILMHGSDRLNNHWLQLEADKAITLGVALGRLSPMALVLPRGGDIANLNYFPPANSYETVVRWEVIPWVEERYCLQNDASGRAIGGISRGGFWAFEIGLRYADQFTAIGGHSPVFAADHPAAFNPLNLVYRVTWTDTSPRLYIDRGADDYWQPNIDLMEPHLDASGVPDWTVVVRETGRHDDVYWGAHLNEYLAFYSATWQAEDYPACELENGGL